jgi:hypothetical protein
LSSAVPAATISAPTAQINDVKAYQIGLSLATKGCNGLALGNVCKKNAVELRAYWQHVEQYALDPNLMDSDFFEGRGNLQGIYGAIGYGFTDNLLAAFRYGCASRINGLIGTGGSNNDIPQVNPIEHYQIFQADLTFKF